jgi:hypothetical protein
MANLLIYAFTAGTPEPTTVASGVWGSRIATLSGNLTWISFGTGEGFASEPTIIALPMTVNTTAALALSNGGYFWLTAAPISGKKLNLTALTLNASRGGASTPRGIKVRSSIDSYANDLYSADLTTTAPTWTNISIDLTGASYQGLTEPITFRFYIWAPTNANSVDADDITLTGTVVSLSDVKAFNSVSLVKTVNGIT